MTLHSRLLHSSAHLGCTPDTGCVGLCHRGCDRTPSLLSVRGSILNFLMVSRACFQKGGSLLVPFMLPANLFAGIVVSTAA
eukprot:scaffold160838_cov44-Tisochrysis_lutea.AAC.1